MEMESLRCSRCNGDQLVKVEEGKFVCFYCGLKQSERTIKAEEIILNKLDEKDRIAYANAKKNLCRATGYAKKYPKTYLSDREIFAAATEVQRLNPDDFLASFYLTALSGDPSAINAFLDEMNPRAHKDYVSEVLTFMFRIMEQSNEGPVLDLIRDSFRGAEADEWCAAFATEKKKIEAGDYEPSLSRDVYLSFAEEDKELGLQVCKLLSEADLSVFTPANNVRIGRGEQGAVTAAIHTAIDNAKCFVFLSTGNSRRVGGDPLTKEIAYFKTIKERKARVEYRYGAYGAETIDLVRETLDECFSSQDVCLDANMLVDQIKKAIAQAERAAAEERERTQRANETLEALREQEKENTEKLKDVASSQGVLIDGVQNILKTLSDDLKDRKKRDEQIRKEEEERQREIQRQREREKRQKELDENFDVDGDVLLRYIGKRSVVEIPDFIKEIADEAFKLCERVTKIVVPAGVEYIGKDVFDCCKSLTSFEVDPYNKRFKAVDGILYTVDGKTILRYPSAKKMEAFSIPKGVTAIGEKCFCDAESLKNVILPDNLEVVGSGAFWNCEKLKTVLLPSSLKRIESTAFYGCKSIASIDLPFGLQEIGKWAFVSCRSLVGIKLPASVKTVGAKIFRGCANLKKVECDKAAAKEYDENWLGDCKALCVYR